jgi:argininosuccinate lyase
MHPADIEAINAKVEFRTEMFKEALIRANLHKAMNARLDLADPSDLHKFASALTELANRASEMEKVVREKRQAGL